MYGTNVRTGRKREFALRYTFDRHCFVQDDYVKVSLTQANLCPAGSMCQTFLGFEHKKGECILLLRVKSCLQISLAMSYQSCCSLHVCRALPYHIMSGNQCLSSEQLQFLLGNKHSEEQLTWSCSSRQHPPWNTFESVCN